MVTFVIFFIIIKDEKVILFIRFAFPCKFFNSVNLFH